jgi:hypothetical protein
MVLTVLAVTLLLVTGGSVNALVPLFAMGVFSAFAMTGYGMTKHHLAHRQHGWRYKLVINLSAGILSTLVVAIFAIAKFTEGAWLIVVVFPALVFTLTRLNRKYRAEASVLEISHTEPPEWGKYLRHRVFLFVDSVDLASIEALHYGQDLHADELTAVHFVLDPARAARLQAHWLRFERDIPLHTLECPNRRLGLAAQELVQRERDNHPDTQITVLLSRRTYGPLVSRLLHDRTADKIARILSRIPGATPQIVAYDVSSRIAESTRRRDKAPRLQLPIVQVDSQGEADMSYTGG